MSTAVGHQASHLFWARAGLAQIYLESLGHRVRRQRPGGGGRKAESTNLLRGQEE